MSVWIAFGSGLYLGFFGSMLVWNAITDYRERRERRLEMRVRRGGRK